MQPDGPAKREGPKAKAKPTGLPSSAKPVSPGLTKPGLVIPVFTQTGFNETGSVTIAVETGSVTDFRFGLRPPCYIYDLFVIVVSTL